MPRAVNERSYEFYQGRSLEAGEKKRPTSAKSFSASDLTSLF